MVAEELKVWGWACTSCGQVRSDAMLVCHPEFIIQLYFKEDDFTAVLVRFAEHVGWGKTPAKQ